MILLKDVIGYNMAHFAELDNNNIVTRVFVVKDDVATAAGPLGENPMHVDGETWCVNFFGTPNWKQTSKDHSFRKQYAGIGYTYDAAKDKFITPQPFPSWSLDANDEWDPPVTHPTVRTYPNPRAGQDILDENGAVVGTQPDDNPYLIHWNEAGQKWTAKDFEDPPNSFNWDVPTLAWVAA
jgi:hypothetical protein|tara:strand:- start:21 stop:563 length:543 start_codon:yes stop_codon:yes gene_type:complete